MQDRFSKDGMTLCWTDPVNMRWTISEIYYTEYEVACTQG